MVLSKFFKGFVTGGLSALSAALLLGVSAHSLEEAKHVLLGLLVAVVSGGVHAGWEAVYPTQPTI